MIQHLALSLAFLGIEPTGGCGCADQSPSADVTQPIQQNDSSTSQPGTESRFSKKQDDPATDTKLIYNYCFCPKFLYSDYGEEVPNYWVVAGHSINSGGGYGCETEEEFLVYREDLQLGTCTGDCTGGDCWEGDAPYVCPEDRQADKSVDECREGCTLPSLRLAAKKGVRDPFAAFGYPAHGHPPINPGNGRPVYVKVLDREGNPITWLKIFDIPLSRSGRAASHQRHRLGFEIDHAGNDPPAGVQSYEVVHPGAADEKRKLVPVVIEVGDCKGCTIDGLYRLTLPGGATHWVRVHTRLPW